MAQDDAVTGLVFRLVTLVVALAALPALGLHPMVSSEAMAVPALHSAHGNSLAAADSAGIAS